MEQKLFFTKDGKDINEGIELKCIKSSPFGFSLYDVILTEFGGECLVEHKIGELYCGEPQNLSDGYGFRYENTE